MPITSTVDHARREIHSIAAGMVTYAEMEDHLLRARDSQTLSYPELFDARAGKPSLTIAEVRRVVGLMRRLSEAGPIGRRAVLVPSGFAFGITRMFEMLVEDFCELKPFLDEQKARIWLASE